MAASNLNLTTSSTLKSSSRTSAAGPASHRVLRGNMDGHQGREEERWGEETDPDLGGLQSPPHLTCPHLVWHLLKPALLVLSLIWLPLLLAKPGSCGRSAPSTHRPRPPRPPSRHTAASYSQICRSQGARVRPGVGRCDYAPRTLSLDNIAWISKTPVASRCLGGSKQSRTVWTRRRRRERLRSSTVSSDMGESLPLGPIVTFTTTSETCRAWRTQPRAIISHLLSVSGTEFGTGTTTQRPVTQTKPKNSN